MDNTIEFIETLLKLNGCELDSLNQVISNLKKELVEVDMDTSGFGVTPMTNKVTDLAKRIEEKSIELRCARQHKHELLLILDNAKEEKENKSDALPITFLKNVKTDLLMRELFQREEVIMHHDQPNDIVFHVRKD